MSSALAFIVAAGISLVAATALAQDLPSWNHGTARSSIVEFVERVTREGSPEFVAEEERIAVFDNDGTLWAEQPAYFQLLYAIDQVRAMAPEHPEWSEREPFKSLLEGDLRAALAGGEKSVLELVAATHAGMTTEEFATSVKRWMDTARHPVTGRRYTEMVYQPMLELLDYLRDHGFTTFIVSGGGIEFMRPWAEASYGIPPEQIVGSSMKTTFELRGDVPVLVKHAEIGSINDGPGKPVNINLRIGRCPIAAFGNSDGDLEMLQWTAAGAGPRLCLLVHHTDAQREWAYDRDSKIGRLDKALDEAGRRGWTVVDMARDWSTVFAAPSTTGPPESQPDAPPDTPPDKQPATPPAGRSPASPGGS
jgi:phosphoglycolate phosphatase-like HAD superfamily hydrolase